MPQRYFLDTSALIARLLHRAPGHAWVEAICSPRADNTVAIAEVTEAETAAALNQLLRGGVIKRKRCEQALALFWRQVDANEYRVVGVSSIIVRRAADLCGTYSLRGYDAVQLACGLVVRDDARAADAAQLGNQLPLGDPIFLTEDKRLADAATAEGFVVDSPLAHP
jgi:predicted nucleic acid-binding protein